MHGDPVIRQRLLEGWLPLTYAINDSEGWGYDGPALKVFSGGAAGLAPRVHGCRRVC